MRPKKSPLLLGPGNSQPSIFLPVPVRNPNAILANRTGRDSLNMPINLSAEHTKLVNQKVTSGEFDSVDAVVGHALDILKERHEALQLEKERIRKLLDERWEQANDPNTKWLDGEQVFAELLQLSQERRSQRR